jgi:hypothetical protein
VIEVVSMDTGEALPLGSWSPAGFHVLVPLNRSQYRTAERLQVMNDTTSGPYTLIAVITSGKKARQFNFGVMVVLL